MEPTAGAQSFLVSGDRYDGFMGRYAKSLAPLFADAAGVGASGRALDVGCGPGALTGVLIERLGTEFVAAIDPSPPFVEDCAARHPGVDVRLGTAESLPYDDGRFDFVLSQLVLHFVSDPTLVGREFRRVLRPGGTVAACVWDRATGMEMLSLFWEAAQHLDPDSPVESRGLRLGGHLEIVNLFEDVGFTHVAETLLEVTQNYASYDDLWSGFLAGVGPAGAYCLSRTDAQRAALREELFRGLGSPVAGFTLGAQARCAVGRAPV